MTKRRLKITLLSIILPLALIFTLIGGIAFGITNMINASKLIDAINADDYGLVKDRLEKGAKPNQRDSFIYLAGEFYIQYPIVSACGEDEINLDIVKLLMEYGANPNLNKKHNLTPLTAACAGDSENLLEVVKYLIDCGADVNLSDSAATPLFYAVYPTSYFADKANIQKRRELFDLLLKNGADINRHCDAGCDCSLLQTAAESCNYLIAEYLLENGLDVNYTGESGYTPLHSALKATAKMENRIKTIQVLLKYNADKNIKTPYGYSAYDLAKTFKDDELRMLFD